jgi:hypothetical protein
MPEKIRSLLGSLLFPRFGLKCAGDNSRLPGSPGIFRDRDQSWMSGLRLYDGGVQEGRHVLLAMLQNC